MPSHLDDGFERSMSMFGDPDIFFMLVLTDSICLALRTSSEDLYTYSLRAFDK